MKQRFLEAKISRSKESQNGLNWYILNQTLMIEAGFKNPDDERASSGTLFDTFLDEEKLEKREQETNSEFPVGSGAMKMITNNVSVDILAELEAMPELKTKYIAGKKKQIASAYKKRGTDRWVDAAAALATTVVSGGFSLYKAFKGKGLTRTYASKQLGASNAPGSKSSKTSNGTKGSPSDSATVLIGSGEDANAYFTVPDNAGRAKVVAGKPDDFIQMFKDFSTSTKYYIEPPEDTSSAYFVKMNCAYSLVSTSHTRIERKEHSLLLLPAKRRR